MSNPEGAPVDERSTGADELWAFEDDDGRITYVYRLDYRVPGQGAVQSKAALAGKITGAIDPAVVQDIFGGGQYKLISKSKGTTTTKFLTVIGEPKSGAPAPASDAPAALPAAAAAPAPAAAALDPIALGTAIAEAVVRGIADRLPAAAPQQPMTIDQMLQLVDRMRPPAPAASSDPATLAKMSLDMFTRGIETAQRTGGEGRSMGDAIVEAMPQLLEMTDKLITARAMQPAAPAPAGPAGGAPPSAAANTAEDLVIAGQVAKALERGVAVEDFADAIELFYPRDRVMQLTLVPPEMIVARLRTFAGQFPALKAETLPQYVAALVEVLRGSVEGAADENGGETIAGA